MRRFLTPFVLNRIERPVKLVMRYAGIKTTTHPYWQADCPAWETECGFCQMTHEITSISISGRKFKRYFCRCGCELLFWYDITMAGPQVTGAYVKPNY